MADQPHDEQTPKTDAEQRTAEYFDFVHAVVKHRVEKTLISIADGMEAEARVTRDAINERVLNNVARVIREVSERNSDNEKDNNQEQDNGDSNSR